MTRLANLEKAGYFPRPASVPELILSYIAAPLGGRILDPCAGEGEALVTMARTLILEPFGVELHGGPGKGGAPCSSTRFRHKPSGREEGPGFYSDDLEPQLAAPLRQLRLEHGYEPEPAGERAS
jgi:hypothetical protein